MACQTSGMEFSRAPFPVAPPPSLFPNQKQRLSEWMMILFSQHLPECAVECLIDLGRPDVGRYLAEAERELLAALLDGPGERLTKAIRDCSNMYLRAEWIYREEMKRAKRVISQKWRGQHETGGTH